MNEPLIIIFLAIMSVVILQVIRGLEFVHSNELKRQARAGNADAQRVYELRLAGIGLWILVWSLFGATTSLLIVALDRWLPVELTVFVGVFVVTILHGVLPWARWPRPSLRLAAAAAKLLRPIVSLLAPVLAFTEKFMARWVEPERIAPVRSGAEMIEIIEASKDYTTAREYGSLVIAKNALLLGDRPVREVMTPRSVVRFVSEADTLSPILLDELHRSGFSRFPVTAVNDQNIVSGTLYLRDAIVQARRNPQVRELMHNDVFYIGENHSLDRLLKTFLRSRHHLFIVVDEYEEISGIVTLEDVLEQIIGSDIVDEFDQYADLRAVARHLADERARNRSLSGRHTDKNLAAPTANKS